MSDITCIWIHKFQYNVKDKKYIIEYKYTIGDGDQGGCEPGTGSVKWNNIIIENVINKIIKIESIDDSKYSQNSILTKLHKNNDRYDQILLKYATDECILVWWSMTVDCDKEGYSEPGLIEKKDFSKLFNYRNIRYAKNLVINKDVLLDIINYKKDPLLNYMCKICINISMLYAYTMSLTRLQNFMSNFRNNPSLEVTPKDINTYKDFIISELVVEKLEKKYGNPISSSNYSKLKSEAKSVVDKYYSLNASKTKYSIAINKIDYRKILEKGAQYEMKEVGFSYISGSSIRDNKFVDLKKLKLLNIIDINQIISPTCSCAYIQSIQYPRINLPNLPICYGSYIISWGVTKNVTKEWNPNSNNLLYTNSNNTNNTDYCESLNNLLRIEGEHVAHFTQMSIYTGVPSSNTKKYLEDIGLPVSVSNQIYDYIVECAQYTMDISVSIFNQYKFHHDLIIFKSSPTGIIVKFEEELLEKYIKQIYYKNIENATSNDFPSHNNRISNLCNIPDMLKSNPSSDIFIFNGNWWNNSSGVPFVNVKTYNDKQLKDLYHTNIGLIKKQLENRCNSLQEKLNNFEISYASGSMKGYDKLLTILLKISLHIFDKIKKDLKLGDKTDELKKFSKLYPNLYEEINNKFYNDILLKVNPSASLPHSGGGPEKNVKNTMGRRTYNLRSNRQIKQQEARTQKRNFERYENNSALQLYNIIKPYEELFRLQYFNFDESTDEEMDIEEETDSVLEDITQRTTEPNSVSKAMETDEHENKMATEEHENKMATKKDLSRPDNPMEIEEGGGGSKKKKKSRIKKKTKKKHKKKYNGRRTVRTKRTGQNHKKNEKTKKKNNKKKVNKKKKK